MQINYYIFSTITERILKVIEYKGITKYKFCKDLGLSKGFLDKPREITTDKYANILAYFPDISPEWLLTGKGDMLRNKEDSIALSILGDNNIQATNSNVHGNEREADFKDEINELKRQLAEKDKVINNLIKQQEKLINKLTS